MNGVRARIASVVLGTVVLGFVGGVSTNEAASAVAGDCRAVASGPFLYHTTVIPDSYVECATPTGRIRVYGVLTRDGVTVENGRRDCRDSSICHLSVDISREDEPGDQQWCVRVWGSVSHKTEVSAAVACESEAF